MSKTNPVFRVLVTKGDKQALAGNKHVSELEPGQIGVFDAESHKALDGTKKVNAFYIAVGIDTDGDGKTDDIVKSTGNSINPFQITSYTFKPHSAGRNMIVALKDYIAREDSLYGLKFTFNNARLQDLNGVNLVTKNYIVKSPCKTPCAKGCPTSDANIITKKLYEVIAADEDGLLKVRIKPRGTVTAAGVTPVDGYITLADVDKLIAYNKTQTDSSTWVYSDLEFETVPTAIRKVCGYDESYSYHRQTNVLVSKVEEFECTGVLEVTQKLAIEQGSGFEVRELEAIQAGWLGTMYRATSNGIARGFVSYAEVGTPYDMITLNYDKVEVNNHDNFHLPQSTFIAVPEADTQTRDSIVGLLDKLNVKPFDALADDATAANTTATAVEEASTANDVTKDGLA